MKKVGIEENKALVDRAVEVAGSQRKLAEVIGVTRQAVGKWKKGLVKNIRTDLFLRLMTFVKWPIGKWGKQK